MLPTLADLRPGDIMFGPIGGFIPGVFPVGLGQLMLKAATRETWRIRHVAVVVGERLIVQAMPSGAEMAPLTSMHWSEGYSYVRPSYKEGQAERVADAALSYVGTPYSFADYAALVGRHARGAKPTDRTWFDEYITTSKRMICSQLADQAMCDAGWHNFDDGRLPQDVMPAELARKLLVLPGRCVIPGLSWTENLLGS